MFRPVHTNIYTYKCQTPNPGQNLDLTLLSSSNNKNNKKLCTVYLYMNLYIKYNVRVYMRKKGTWAFPVSGKEIWDFLQKITNKIFTPVHTNIYTYKFQTPNPGQNRDLTLLSRSNNKNNKNSPHPNSCA